jgi:hypothetical protein
VTVLDLLLQIVLGVVFTAWVIRRDMRRAPPARLARSWNDASFWSAVVAFGPLSIPVHFVRTRRSFVGLLVGLVAMAAVFAALALVSTVLGFVSGD